MDQNLENVWIYDLSQKQSLLKISYFPDGQKITRMTQCGKFGSKNRLFSLNEVKKDEFTLEQFDMLGQMVKTTHDNKKYINYAQKFMSFSKGSSKNEKKDLSEL